MYDENGNRRMFSVPVDGGLFADDAGRRRDSQVPTFVCLEVASRRQQQFALAFNLEVMNRFLYLFFLRLSPILLKVVCFKINLRFSFFFFDFIFVPKIFPISICWWKNELLIKVFFFLCRF